MSPKNAKQKGTSFGALFYLIMVEMRGIEPLTP